MKRAHVQAAAIMMTCMLLMVSSVFAQTSVTVWSWDDPIGNWIADRADTFNQNQSDIQVVVELGPYEGFFDKARLAIVGGVGPDIVRAALKGLHDPYPQDFYEPNLTEYMTKKAESLAFWGEFIEADGNVYGVPWVVWPALLWYNVDLLAEAGIGKAPETWDELLQKAKKLTKVDGNGNIIQSGFAMREWDFQEVFLPQTVPDFFRAGSRSVRLRGTEAEDAYRFMLDLKDAGIFDWPPRAWQADQFRQGKTAMTFMGSWMLGHLRDFPEIDWNVAPQPRPHQDAPYGILAVAADLRFGRGISEAKKQAGAAFLRYLYQQENIADLTVQTGLLPARLDYYQWDSLAGSEDAEKLLQVAEPVLPNSVHWLQGTSWDALMGGTIGRVIWSALERGDHPEQVMLDIETEAQNALSDYYAGE